ncbi:hypothetical protein ACFWRV_24325 [Streptomyces sp. NPDC058576]|uniref:hypothetical protein n=1 Tax=Streptomyces sp. NPDC058576 TaxID=3346547 RepID=UPI00365C315B
MILAAWIAYRAGRRQALRGETGGAAGSVPVLVEPALHLGGDGHDDPGTVVGLDVLDVLADVRPARGVLGAFRRS